MWFSLFILRIIFDFIDEIAVSFTSQTV